MTTTTTITEAPESVLDVTPLHLSITNVSGKTPENENLHLMEDGDISVKLSRGGESIGQHVEGGIVLIALDVDGDSGGQAGEERMTDAWN